MLLAWNEICNVSNSALFCKHFDLCVHCYESAIFDMVSIQEMTKINALISVTVPTVPTLINQMKFPIKHHVCILHVQTDEHNICLQCSITSMLDICIYVGSKTNALYNLLMYYISFVWGVCVGSMWGDMCGEYVW